MKNLIKNKGWVAGAALLLAGMVAGSGALAGISTTKHNLSSSGTGTFKATDTTEICVFCHTPHGANTTANTPLWNRNLSGVAAYGVYSNNNSLDSTPGEVAGGSTTTNLCLSCHDGTIALNSLLNYPNPSTSITMAGGVTTLTGSANLGSDLTNDHPVNMTYDSNLVTLDTARNGGVAGLNNPATLTGVKLFANSTVQCASCHDPHTSAQATFLRVTMSASALCTTCHIK